MTRPKTTQLAFQDLRSARVSFYSNSSPFPPQILRGLWDSGWPSLNKAWQTGAELHPFLLLLRLREKMPAAPPHPSSCSGWPRVYPTSAMHPTPQASLLASRLLCISGKA